MADNERIEEALRRHLAVLCEEIGARAPLFPEKLARAQSYITAAFERAGLDVTEQGYAYHGQRVANVIAAPKGSSSVPAYYLVGAHYDTVPSTPGADDNGSGIAVLLELARRIAARPPKVPVRFVAKLEPGFAMTIEPGIYFIEFLLKNKRIHRKHRASVDFERAATFLDVGGVRLEDDIIIQPSGSPRNLTTVPKEVVEVEACRQAS